MPSLPRTPQMGVYAITHTPTGRHYIGATIDMHLRWNAHRRQLRYGNHDNKAFQRAWNSTTPTEWTWTVLEVVTERAMLAERERWWVEQGAPVFGAPRRPSWHAMRCSFTAERFWARVDKTETCWEWTGCLSSAGYGKVSYQNRSGYTHRLAWVLTYGPIPEGLCVLHHCDNRKCCRPDHLFLGTKTDNAADRQSKGRHRNATVPRERTWFVLHPEFVPRGETNPHAKLTDDDVRTIRLRAQAGETHSAIARDYPTTVGNIGGIVHGQRWKHVGGPTRAARPSAARQLSVHDVRSIRARHADGSASVGSMAREYGVPRQLIGRIVHRTSRADVP